MISNHLSLGRLGENASALYLRSNGYKIIDRNVKFGIGEIDIIAYKGSTLYVLEVKTRKITSFVSPYEAVDKNKARKLILMGEKYCLQKKLNHTKLSLGVIAVLVDETNRVRSIKVYDYFL